MSDLENKLNELKDIIRKKNKGVLRLPHKYGEALRVLSSDKEFWQSSDIGYSYIDDYLFITVCLFKISDMEDMII